MSVSTVPPWEHFDHAIMNLPATAIEFLDVFNGLLEKDRWRGPLPQIHCYCFAKTDETDADVIKVRWRKAGRGGLGWRYCPCPLVLTCLSAFSYTAATEADWVWRSAEG